MKYTKARAKVVMFDNSDVITASYPPLPACGNDGVTSQPCSWDSFTGGGCKNRGFYNNPDKNM